MQKLVWSDELARIAQTWADQCDCVFQQNQVQIIRLGRDKNDCVFHGKVDLSGSAFWTTLRPIKKIGKIWEFGPINSFPKKRKQASKLPKI